MAAPGRLARAPAIDYDVANLRDTFPATATWDAVPSIRFAGLKVESIDRTDGQKLLFAGNRWILFRPSGTEPVVRIYAESSDEKETDRLLTEAKKYVLTSEA